MAGRVVTMVALVAAVGMGGLASAGDRFGLRDDGPPVPPQVQFRDARGGAFYPKGIVIALPGGAQRAALSGNAQEVTWEDRVDLSAMPLIGQVFRPVLDPAAAAKGALVGPVHRIGDDLVVRPQGTGAALTDRPVTLTAHLPGINGISFRLGRLGFRPGGTSTSGTSTSGTSASGNSPIGMAYLLDGALVIASDSGAAQRPSLVGLLDGFLN